MAVSLMTVDGRTILGEDQVSSASMIEILETPVATA
jgi:hypothetical protein